jgi:hypothetical protein
MPRRERVRRFKPRYGVSQSALDEETKAVEREADDYSLLARSDLEHDRQERHALTSAIPIVGRMNCRSTRISGCCLCTTTETTRSSG